MEFNNNFPEWKNEGTSPPEDLKNNGFKGGDKPPAPWLNWLCNLIGKCISEIQSKLHLHSEDKNNPHGVTASQVGLDKVNNTSDAEKSVKFASEANSSRKVQNALTLRFKGGNTEGTDLWTYDGSTSRSVNITAEKIGAANKEHKHTLNDIEETSQKKHSYVVPAISTDGEAYTATVDGVTALYNGMEITIIPNMTSTKNAITLDVNGLGARNVRMSIGGYNLGNSGTIAAIDSWLGADCPVTLVYKAKFDNWQTVISRPSVTGLYGTVKVEQGGTGASTVEGALENLGLSHKADTEILTYTGNGTHGANNPCSVKCNFVPKVLMMLGNVHSDGTQESVHTESTNNLTVIFCDKLSTSYSEGCGFKQSPTMADTPYYAKKSDDGKTIYWYNEGTYGNAYSQYNDDGKTYYVLAIG